jgi:phage repressor protein C with HTH and peptisase S24 domain
MAQTGCSAEGLEPFALRVIGDSMEPEFKDGHIILVDPGFPLLDGVYAVINNNGEFIFGQYSKENSESWIRYLNPDFEAVKLEVDFEVKGVITQRNGPKRKDVKRYDYSD